MPDNFQASHFGAMFASKKAQYDIQRSYQFYVDFTQAQNAFEGNAVSSQSGTVVAKGAIAIANEANSMDNLMFAVQNFNPPSQSNAPIEYYFGNSKIKLAGKAEVATGDMTMVDFVKPDIEKMLVTWYNKVFNVETAQTQLNDAYKFPLKLTQWAGDGTLERTWQLEGCFPTSLSFGSMDYTSNDKKQISVTFSIDLAYRLFDKN